MAPLTREQRLTLRLMKYWNLIRKDHEFPRIEYFNSAAIEDIWPDCVQLRLNSRGESPTFWCEYMGERLMATYGKDISHQVLENSTQTFPGIVMYSKLNEMTVAPAPMENNGHMMSDKGGILKYRACFLPFCNDKLGLTHIIIGLSYRVFH